MGLQVFADIIRQLDNCIVNLSNMARKCRDQFSIEKKFKYTCISGPIYLRQPRHTCVINLNKLEQKIFHIMGIFL